MPGKERIDKALTEADAMRTGDRESLALRTIPLEWKGRFGGGVICCLSDTLVLMTDMWRGEAHNANVVVGNKCVYRSEPLADLEAAKRECIRQGAKAARRLSREYAEIAERLGGAE